MLDLGNVLAAILTMIEMATPRSTSLAEGIRILYSSGTGESADGGNVRPIGGRKSKMRLLPVMSEANTAP